MSQRTTVWRYLPVLAIVLAACGEAGAASAPGVDLEPVSTTATTTTTTTSTTTSTTTTTVAPTTTLAPTTTAPPPPTAPAPTTTIEPPPDLPGTAAAFERLAGSNAAASVTVVRDGAIVFAQASGTTIEGSPAGPDTPMVVASISKLITATAVARLSQEGLVDPAQPMPWAELGLAPHPAWADVTVRELLDHESGMPVARWTWFEPPGDCAGHLPGLIQDPPRGHRGEWTYSNGNYCALGLLVEQRTGLPLDAAAQQLVFDPLGLDGAHLTLDGHRPGDVFHEFGIERLGRLGGAGTFIASTDDVALMMAATTDLDRAVLQPPGVLTDQYGWGHTGTVDGAKACAWVIEAGRTVVAATVAGNSPGSGGGVCDIVIPALAGDLGIGAGKPERLP